ncbi:MAG: hypothetical protein J5504_12070, partial [Butyrivibrio sp.]|nr:hypothetical protein [Butyrivibrio sp.]
KENIQDLAIDTRNLYQELARDGELSKSDWGFLGKNVAENFFTNLILGELSEVVDILKPSKELHLKKVEKAAEEAENVKKVEKAIDGTSDVTKVVGKQAENIEDISKGSVKNWKGKEVKIPDGHKMSPRDPDFSAKPITEAGPYTTEQRKAFLDGKSANTKLAPHHRHQIPVRDGGVIDELPGPGHPCGNQHTAGTPSRHPARSIFNNEPGGNVLRNNEITQSWIEKGNRLIEVEPGVWIDPGF